MKTASRRSLLVARLPVAMAALAALAAVPALVLPLPVAARSVGPYVHVLHVDESRFPTVKVDVSITDEQGQPVGVGVAHLVLAEDGVEVLPEDVKGENEPGPLATLLLVDSSASMVADGKLAAAQSAAEAILDQMRAGDRAAVLAYNADVAYAQTLTADYRALERAVARLADWNDTTFVAAPSHVSHLLEDLPGRKALIALTDGVDEQSRSTLGQIIGQLESGQLLIAAVDQSGGPPTRASSAPADETTLRSLAAQAGGHFASTADADALLDLYQQLAHPLPSAYEITYTSPGAQVDRVKHTVSVGLAEEGTAGQVDYYRGGAAPSRPGLAAMLAPANLLSAGAPALAGLVRGGRPLGGILLALVGLLAIAPPLRRSLAGARLPRRAARPKPIRFGADLELPVFPNYLLLQARSRVTPRTWLVLRLGSVAGALACVWLLFTRPATGLWLFWQLTVPLLPALFLVAPGVWRNVCPLASANQMPRRFKFSRALSPPGWLREHGFLIGVVLFFALASSRKWLFNSSGPATAVLILAALGGAWLGGFLFKGKSGWCSSVCPLYPTQRLYNRTPFATIANAHCSPCVSCTKNCYDFNPGTAYLADLTDRDPHYASYRRFFAAAMPGFVAAYFVVPSPSSLSGLPGMYLQMALYVVLSIGVYGVLDGVLRLSASKLTAFYGAAAFSLYYWFALPGWLKAAGSLLALTPPRQAAWGLQAAILLLSLVWVGRTFRRERLFLDQRKADSPAAPASAAQTVVAAPPPSTHAGITFQPGDVRVPLESGLTLLEIAEAHNQPLEAGCRMGVCGADPIVVQAGMENLSPVGSDEKSTLERLGLGPNCRLACMCRVQGPVTVSLDTKSTAAECPAPAPAAPLDYDRSLKSVVVVGNGVAGVTAADYVRRRHPECDIHIVSREKHHLYNRMAITRLIYGRSAMSGLYLQPEAWYDERRITCWLNTHVTHINRGHKQVLLATGETLAYDRLILASGSSSFVPAIAGFGLPGTFTLREAEEAMEVRAYIQHQRCLNAVVAGGGLLGLEAAHALHKMGLTVWVLERGPALLRRQLDERASQLLQRQLAALGLNVITQAETDAVLGAERVTDVRLKDGRTLPCDVFVAAAGVRPNVELARSAGLEVKRGVVVDEQMRTSAPDVYAAGDVCEFSNEVPGLWAMAVEQARVAAVNATGGEAAYAALASVTLLKVAGVDLTSAGRIAAQADDEIEFVLEDEANLRYRKLVIAGGRVVGAILLGYPREATAAAAAVKAGSDVSRWLPALRAGQWEVLQDLR